MSLEKLNLSGATANQPVAPEGSPLEPPTVEEMIEKYEALGFKVEPAQDEPRRLYPPHQHHEVYLFGIDGSTKVWFEDNSMVELLPGVEIHIPEGMKHSAIVGPDGASYIFAYPAEIDEPFSYEP